MRVFTCIINAINEPIERRFIKRFFPELIFLLAHRATVRPLIMRILWRERAAILLYILGA